MMNVEEILLLKDMVRLHVRKGFRLCKKEMCFRIYNWAIVILCIFLRKL